MDVATRSADWLGEVIYLMREPASTSGPDVVRLRMSSVGRVGLVTGIRDLEPLIGRWRQVIHAPRHVEEPVNGEMTLEWLRDQKVIIQRSIAENPMFPESVVVIMAADEAVEGGVTAHYFDSRAVERVLHMSFRDGVWRWWRHATGPDDFDQRFEGTLSADGTTIESSCFLVEDGEWIHDFDVSYTRA